MSKKTSELLTPLAKARGLGAAKSGFHHWWVQRLTAIALIPLTAWFAWQLMCLAAHAKDVADMAEWMGNPFHALPLLTLIIAMFWHAALGLQVVIEDYVTCPCSKMTLLIGTKFICFGAALVGAFAIIKLHFGL